MQYIPSHITMRIYAFTNITMNLNNLHLTAMKTEAYVKSMIPHIKFI